MVESISNLIKNRRYTEAMNEIQQLLPQSDRSERDELRLYKLRIHRLQGDFQQALDFVEDKLSDTVFDSIEHEVRYCLDSAAINYRMGNIEKAIELLKTAKQVIFDNEEELDVIYKREYYDLRGKIYLFSNDLDNAEATLHKGLEISSEEKMDRLQASMLNATGIVYFDQGDLERAKEYYTQALEINQHLGDLKQMGMCYNNIGYISYIRGEPDEAIKYLNLSLDAITKFGIDYHKAVTLFNLIRSHLMLDQISEANKYLSGLNGMAEKEENSKNVHIQSLFKLSKAIMKKQGQRLRDKYEAEQLFQQVIEADIEHQYIIIAMIHLAEILIMELKITDGDEILTKITEMTTELQSMAAKMNSVTVEIQTTILEAKLSRVNSDYRKAHQLYEEILRKARDNKLHMLASEIVEEIDQMQQEVKKMSQILDQNPSITERLKIVELRSYLDDLKNMV